MQRCRFGFVDGEYFTLFKYSCDGNETSLSACALLSSVDVNCATNDPDSALAANCGEENRGLTGETEVQFIISNGSSMDYMCPP